MPVMKPLGPGLNPSMKTTRKCAFPEALPRVVPWAVRVRIEQPHDPRAQIGRPPSGIATALRIGARAVDMLRAVSNLLPRAG